MHKLYCLTWYQSRLDPKEVCKKPSYTYFSLETHHPRKVAVSSEWWDFSKKPLKKIDGKPMTTSSEENQPLPTANVAHPGIIDKASIFSATSKNRTWIIDTSASDHMTWDSNQLKSVLPSS